MDAEMRWPTETQASSAQNWSHAARLEVARPAPSTRNGFHRRKSARQDQAERWTSRQGSEAETPQAGGTSEVQRSVVEILEDGCVWNAFEKRCIGSDCLALTLSTCLSSSFHLFRPLFSVLSSARLCPSPVHSVMVYPYFCLSLVNSIFPMCYPHRGFHASRDFSDSRSSKTPRYFDELVKTSSLL